MRKNLTFYCYNSCMVITSRRSAMSDKISILFPNKNLEFRKLSETTVHDIGMDGIVAKLSAKIPEQTYISNVMRMLTEDTATARFRSDVFEDILKNKKMRNDIIEILDKINFLREFGSFKHDHDHEPQVWDLLHRLGELDDYIKSIEALVACLSDADIHSEGLISLKNYVEGLYNDNGFGELKKDISLLRADTQNLKSVTLGVNLNQRFEAVGIGIISINNKPFTKSGVISNFMDKVSGKDNIKNGNDWDGDYRFQEFTAKSPIEKNAMPVIPPLSPMALMSIKYISESEDSIRSVTNYMDDITEKILSKTVRHLRDVLGRYTTLTITDITDLMPEFIYYIRWAEYIDKLRERGFKFCKPEVLSNKVYGDGDTSRGENSPSLSAAGIYNMKLLQDSSVTAGDIVPNDISFDPDHTLYILTGANRGGKTTITQAVGQAVFMAQGGIYVTGDSFSYVPVDAIFTHFPADEDKTLDLGRLGEECKRFREIYEQATSKSLLLLNETFSTTSFEEGYYIARDCCRAILSKGIRTIYNTHMHKLAMDLDVINMDDEIDNIIDNGGDIVGDNEVVDVTNEVVYSGNMAVDTSNEAVDAGNNSETSKDSPKFKKKPPFRAASLIVLSDQGQRSYKVKVAPPEGMSYARDIAEKYGVTYDSLLGRS